MTRIKNFFAAIACCVSVTAFAGTPENPVGGNKPVYAGYETRYCYRDERGCQPGIKILYLREDGQFQQEIDGDLKVFRTRWKASEWMHTFYKGLLVSEEHKNDPNAEWQRNVVVRRVD